MSDPKITYLTPTLFAGKTMTPDDAPMSTKPLDVYLDTPKGYWIKQWLAWLPVNFDSGLKDLKSHKQNMSTDAWNDLMTRLGHPYGVDR